MRLVEKKGQLYYPQRVNGQQSIFIEQQGTSKKPFGGIVH